MARLRELVAADCARMQAAEIRDPCGAHFPQLPALFGKGLANPAPRCRQVKSSRRAGTSGTPACGGGERRAGTCRTAKTGSRNDDFREAVAELLPAIHHLYRAQPPLVAANGRFFETDIIGLYAHQRSCIVRRLSLRFPHK